MLTKDELELLSKELKEYRCHYDELQKADEVLNNILGELKGNAEDNDINIEYHEHRIKTSNSFLNKVLRDYRDETKEPEEKVTFENSHDLVGHRLICLNLSDINNFFELIKNSDKVRILEEETARRNYIEHRKPSGYRSLHVILEIPFKDDNGFETSVKAEIQLRTIFMHFFSVFEHYLGFKNKGKLAYEDKKALRDMSDELYSHDLILDDMPKPTRKEQPGDLEELEIVEQEYNKGLPLFNIVYSYTTKTIFDWAEEYQNKNDILYKKSRLKSPSSAKRKLKRKKLSYTCENMVYVLKDMIALKFVLKDIKSTRGFIDYLKEKTNSSDVFRIKEESDHLEEPKESGYRGYKICLEYCPKYLTEKPITFEILVRTHIQDVWAEQQDSRIYNKEDCYDTKEEYIKAYRKLKGLSITLNRCEKDFSNIKENNIANVVQAENLVKEVKEYDRNKKLLLLKKDEE